MHPILAENIPLPDLVVYLRADTDVLMERIAFRDRSYERDMDRGYIHALNNAYEGFFAAYDEAPVLHIDTNELNIVSRPEDLEFVAQHIKSALRTGVHQQPLPRLGWEQGPREESRPLSEERGVVADPALTFIRLQEAMGGLASELREVWGAMERHYGETGDRASAFRRACPERSRRAQGTARRSALGERFPGLREELESCLAHLFDLADDVGIDLEEVCRERMRAGRAS